MEYSNIRCLVVGTGSIGKRHIFNLLQAGVQTAIFSTGHTKTRFQDPRVVLSTDDWQEALSFAPHLAIVANPTALHVSTIEKLIDQDVYILVEKPLSNHIEDLDRLFANSPDVKKKIIVGYNFRFHAAIQFLKQTIADNIIGKISYIKCQVGQYLPDWHPGEDYREGYVARAELGGGVVRTLSHEIDYVDYLIGQPIREISCMTSNISDLEIDVEDTANILIRYEKSIAEIHMDMVRRIPVRELVVYGDNGYLKWNDMKNTIHIQTAEGEKVIWESGRNERDMSFIQELKALLNSVLHKKIDDRFGDPMKTIEVISGCLTSAQQNNVVSWKR